MTKPNLNVYNKRGVLLTKVYNENGKETQVTYDKFGRLLYHVYGMNRSPVFNHEGKILEGIYDDKGRPRCTIYNGDGEEIVPIIDELGRPIDFTFDKDGVPLYDAGGKLWENIINNLSSEVRRKRRKPMRRGRGGPVTQKEINEMNRQIHQLRQQLLQLIKSDRKKYDRSDSKSGTQSKKENSPKLFEEFLSSTLKGAVKDALSKTDTTESNSAKEDLKQNKNEKVEQAGIHKELKDDILECVEKHVGFDTDCGAETKCDDDKMCVIFQDDDDETCGAEGILVETNETLEDLEYRVKNIYDMCQEKEPFYKNVADALVLITQSMHNLYCNSKNIMNEHEDIAVELEDQYDELKELQKRKTMPWNIQEKCFEDIHLQLEYMFNYQEALKWKKCEHKVVIDSMELYRQIVVNQVEDMEKFVQKIRKEHAKILDKVQSLKKEIPKITTKQSFIAENIQKKADKEECDAFKDCAFGCLRTVEDYINGFMKKPLILSDLKERQYFQCECSEEGVVKIGINVEQPEFPGIDLFKSKSCKKFIDKIEKL